MRQGALAPRLARLVVRAAAVTAAAIAAAPAAAAPAAAAGAGAAGQVSISIGSMTPQWAAPGRSVTVTGVVSNGTAIPVQGLSVQLRSSSSEFGSRDALSAYASGQYQADQPVGAPVTLPASIAPHSQASWRAVFRPAAAGITQFGVYPLAAQVLDSAGVPGPVERTFLPFWPGGSAARAYLRLRIAWVWPLVDQPRQAACAALTGTGLAASLAPAGRLGALLAAGALYSAGARLTWAIDPALVREAQMMSRPYLAGAGAACGRARKEPASRTARAWLAKLAGAIAGQRAFLTPYADVDVAALSHNGLGADLRRAFALSRSLAGQAPLRRAAVDDSIAWPPGGLADAGVLGSLAANGITTVVLDSSVMPPSGQAPSYTPSAQATASSGARFSLRVLLADHTVSQLLGSAPSAPPGPGAAFASAQRFLAETAMIVAELPSVSRSLVVAPPRRWAPAAGLPGDLLRETVRAPWLVPSSLAALAGARQPSGTVPRRPPLAHHVSGRELSRAYLAQVKRIDAAVRLQASIFTPPRPAYLAAAVAVLESSAWQGGAHAAVRQELLSQVRRYVAAQGKNVGIIDKGQFTMGGTAGKIPVSIDNRMPYTIKVGVRASVSGQGRLAIGSHPGTVTVAPGKTMTIRLAVRDTAVGDTQLTLALLTPAGRPLPGTVVRLSVRSTRFGRLALVILSVALGVFVLTSAARAVRRARRDRAAGGPETQHPGRPADPAAVTAPAGSVVSGEHLAPDYPPEDPDEYADARGRASR